MQEQNAIQQVLFKSPAHSFRVIEEESSEPDDLDAWSLCPIEGKTLAKEYVEGPFEGRFIVEGQIVKDSGTSEQCYLEVILPERICEYRYVLINGSVARLRGRRTSDGTAIPSIAIEKFGVPQLFYAKENPSVGIKVLEDALRLAKEKKYVAYDLGMLLREQKRYKEAIEAFTVLLSEEVAPHIARTAYKERAQLYTTVGQHELAAKDKQSWSLAFESAYGRPPAPEELF